MLTDLPYLEPLLFHLRADETLKKFFSERSFFMPKNTLIQATKEAMEKDCPSPRALWIIPEGTTALSSKSGCPTIGSHSFSIVIFIHCIREAFELLKRDNKVVLGGEFMELSKIRRAVKKSVNQFENINKQNFDLNYKDIAWQGDTPLFPDEDGFIVSSTEYSVILN